MENFIRSLPNAVGNFIRRTYSVMLYNKFIFAIVNVDNKPAIIINSRIYFPTNLQYHFSSNNVRALLAYKDDKMWIVEERTCCGQITCQVGFKNPPTLTWHNFIT